MQSRDLTGSLRLIGTKIYPIIWHAYRKSVLNFQAHAMDSCGEVATKIL